MDQRKEQISNAAQEQLAEAGYTVHVSNHGAHLQISTLAGLIDFWPTTGKWWDGRRKKRGYDMKSLMKYLQTL